MRNLFTPVIGFVIGSGFYLSTKVLADTQSGKMPGPKSFGYFIAAITAASVAGVAMLGKERNYYSEEGSAPIQDPMEFGEMANWRPLDGTPGLKRQRAESGSGQIEHDPIYTERMVMVEEKHDHPYSIYDWSSPTDLDYDDEEELRDSIIMAVSDRLSDARDDEDFDFTVDISNHDNIDVSGQTWLGDGRFMGYAAEEFRAGPADSIDVGEKQQTRNKREDFTISSNYTSDLEVGDIDLDVSEVSDEFHDELVDTIRESVDENLPLETGDSDSGTMDVDFQIELPVDITGTVDWDWESDLNYETDNDVDEHEWNAEQATARVRTMSGKPVSQTLRKMKHDKNITPEEARERKEIRAENFRKY